MKYRYKFRKKYLNQNQSLKYQIMLIFMEEHKRARLGLKSFGEYFGNDSINFNNEEWLKICNVIEKSISNNHKKLIDDIKNIMTIDEYIFSLIENENYSYLFHYEENMDVRIFTITPNGYSYQFNGYMKSDDKANKINNKIQKLILILTTLMTIYYVGSWFKPELDLKDLKMLLKIITEFKLELFVLLRTLNVLLIEFFKIAVLTFLNFLLINKFVDYMKNKFNI